MVAAHSYCGGKAGADGRHSLGFISPRPRVSTARGSLTSKTVPSHRRSWRAWPRAGGTTAEAEFPEGPWGHPQSPFAGEGMVFGEEGWLIVGGRCRTDPHRWGAGVLHPWTSLQGDSQPGTL